MESKMSVVYTVGPIKRHQVDKAYRLIEAAGCHFDLQAWREFCAGKSPENAQHPKSNE